jgi:FAD:protein FMN transferase
MYHSVKFRCMNTDVCILLWAHDSEAGRALNQAKSGFISMQDKFTRFDKDSELSVLNNSAGKPFKASAELYEVVELAVQYYYLTNGKFNPAIIFALEAIGYDRSFEQLQEIKIPLPNKQPVPSLNDIELNRSEHTITMPGHIRLDLGGIAKGWTVQQTAKYISQYGPCLVNAGGDIMTCGTVPKTTDWLVGITDPFNQNHTLMKIAVNNAGVATSGINKRRWQANGIPMHHIIDPFTGLPSVSDIFAATVVASDAVKAEIFAKVVFLLGSESGLDYVNEHPELETCIFTNSGQTLFSKDFKRYVQN